jgi:hypothetical protein
MSAFSFTAPFVTPEQEKEEFNSFSEAEREKIHRDLHGTVEVTGDEPAEFLPTSFVRALPLLQDALDAIPEGDKADYMEALERAPDLVRRESPSELFLRVETLDTRAAARRLVYYWKLRKEFFGPELAFLPMTMEGAMRNDQDLFDLGFISILPSDESGRAVMYWNRVACTSDVAPRYAFLRVLFYNGQVALEMQDAPTNGFVLLYNARGFDLYRHFDRILMKKVLKMTEAFPYLVRGFHMITGSGRSVLGLVLPVLKQVIGQVYRHRLRVHAGSDKEIVDRLSDYGIIASSVPSSFGGDWHRSDFLDWKEKRLLVEATSHNSFE